MTIPAISVSIIGSGGHLPDAAEIAAAGVRVATVLDPTGLSDSEVRAEAAAVCARPDSGLVIVDLAPRALQVDVAEIALRAGRHVLIERPAATTSPDLARLVAAEGDGHRLWERATTFVEPPFPRLREIIARGEIGEVVLVSTTRSYPWASWRPRDESVTGGLVLQSAGYGLDIAQLVTGRALRGVRVLDTRTGSAGGPRRAALVTADLDGGALASAAVDYLKQPGPSWGRVEVVVQGTEGTLRADGISREVSVSTADGERVENVAPAPGALLAAVAAAVRGDASPVSPEMLRASTAALLEALETDRETVGPAPDTEELA